MKPRTGFVLSSASILIAAPGVILPLLITFVDAFEQYVTEATNLRFLANEGFISMDLFVYPLFFLPTNIIALVLGILTRRRRRGKAGIVLSAIGIMIPIGACLGMLIVYVILLIRPPVIRG